MRFALAFSLALAILLGMHDSLAAEPPSGSHRIEVSSLNSPVKSDNANFKLNLPEGMTADRASYRIEVVQTSSKLKSNIPSGQTEIQLKSGPKGITVSIPVDEIAPGKFLAHFKIKPSKEWWTQVKEFLKITDSRSNPGELHGQASFEIDSSLEVPNPGKAGSLTIEGIDSDKDGVRDDVQRWINETFPESPKVKEALKQLAKYQQLELSSAENKQTSVEATKKTLYSIACLRFVLGEQDEDAITNELQVRMENTEARIRASLKVDAHFSGQFHRLLRPEEQKNACEFSL